MRFRTQLRRTRPVLISRLESAFTDTVKNAGGQCTQKRRLLSAVLPDARSFFVLDMVIFLESLKKHLEEAGRDLTGHALVVGRNIQAAESEQLCRMLSGSAVSRCSGIWCEGDLLKELEPFLNFETRFKGFGELSLFQNPVGFGQALGKTGQKPGFPPKSKEAVPKTEVLEQPQLKDFKSPSRPGDLFPYREKISRALSRNSGKNTLLTGLRFIGKRDGLYHYCAPFLGDAPALVFRFGSGCKGCAVFTDALSPALKSFLSEKIPRETLDDLYSLGDFLFRERLSGKLFPSIKEGTRRFLKILLESYIKAFHARGIKPILILEDLSGAQDETAALFRETFNSLDGKDELLVFGISPIQGGEVPQNVIRDWAGIFPRILKFAPEDFPAGGRINMPAPLWEAAYCFALLGKFFPAWLFPRLFEEEGLSSKTPEKAVVMLKKLGLIDTAQDPRPLIPDFYSRAEKILGEGVERIRGMLRRRLLAWVNSGGLDPSFGFLDKLAELGGRIDDFLVLRALRVDVIKGTCSGIAKAVEKNAWPGGTAQSERPELLTWIYQSQKALVQGDEHDIRSFLKRNPPELPSSVFPGFKAQVHANLACVFLSVRDTASAESALSRAMLLNQNVKDPSIPAYRLFALFKLFKGHFEDAIEYINFAIDRSAPVESTYQKNDETQEQIKSLYFAACINYLYGNLAKAERFAYNAEKAAARFIHARWAEKARFIRGRILFETGSYEEARELFSSLLKNENEKLSPKRQTLEAWVYRSRFFALGLSGGNWAAERPKNPNADALVFMAEAAFLSGSFKETLDLSGDLLKKSAEADGDFTFIEQADWQSGFSQCEYLLEPRGTYLRRLALMHRSLALSRLQCQGEEKAKAVSLMRKILREDLLPDGDPNDSFYYFAFYSALKDTSSPQVDISTAVSMGFKRLQRRASRIDDTHLRQSYLSANYWNRALNLAAKEYKLI
jgi:tetratricopeptide (TPR) repeat protein